MSELSQKILQAVSAQSGRMNAALDYLWAHPETGYREWESTHYLENAYEALGYTITRAGDIPGFTAEFDTGRPGPRILIFSELDSVICREHPQCNRETGAVHSCGHCAQGACLLGVAAAMKEMDTSELCGSVRFAIVPAEELLEIGFREGLRKQGTIRFFGGKPEFLRRGLLDGCDISFMVHSGGGRTRSFGYCARGNGCVCKSITFMGKEAHAGGQPHNGINALYAANMGINAINAIRETFKEEDYTRVHPIITKGGEAVNTIPATVTMESYVRGGSYEAIRSVNAKVNRALAGGALSIGANVHITDNPGYMPQNYDKALGEVFRQAGLEFADASELSIGTGYDTGCTDMGDMSGVMPSIHLFGWGAEGTGHGSDYYIVERKGALDDTARLQLHFIWKLLSDGAAAAREVIANAKPVFPTFADYFAAQESLMLDQDAITYGEGGARISWAKEQ